MDRFSFFKSLLDQDPSAVVICDTDHKIIYMNPTAMERYRPYGGEELLGKNLLDCHGGRSREMINKVLAWFQAAPDNNCVHTFYNEKENKDVYMIALRDAQGSLIGYYEKHAYRDRDMTPFYDFD